jgi:hypothetical protein
LALSQDPVKWRFYQSLVSDISNTLPERMAAYQPPHSGEVSPNAGELSDALERQARVPFKLKLRAFWRYPFASRKRKAYRNQRA